MQLVINIEKRHFVIIVALISLLGIFMIATAEDVNPDLPWHPLHQVAKSSSDETSVDENKNGMIDWAENVSWSGVQSKPAGFADNTDHYLPQNPATSNVNMNSNRITDLQNPANPQDAATRSWVNTNDEYLPENPASSNVNMDGNQITNTDLVKFQNHEWGDRNTDGGVYWDKSAGLYVRSSNAPNSNSNGRLLWSGANVHEGSNIDISYNGEDEPTISASGGAYIVTTRSRYHDVPSQHCDSSKSAPSEWCPSGWSIADSWTTRTTMNVNNGDDHCLVYRETLCTK